MEKKYQEIYESHINGQNKQMIEQAKALSGGLYDFAGCLQWVEENFSATIALDMAIAFFRIEYR